MKYRLFFPRSGHMLAYWRDQLPSALVYECVYAGEVVTETLAPTGRVVGGVVPVPVALEFLWQRHNEGDALDGNRPRAKEIRSACVGDILLLEGCPFPYFVDCVFFVEMSLMQVPVGINWEDPVV